MLSVRVQRGEDGCICGFVVRGHAGFAVRGQDIVCAAVSALTQTAVLALQQRLGVGAAVTMGAGSLTCRIPASMDEMLAVRVQDTLETMCLGLREIEAIYPTRVTLADPAGGIRRRDIDDGAP